MGNREKAGKRGRLRVRDGAVGSREPRPRRMSGRMFHVGHPAATMRNVGVGAWGGAAARAGGASVRGGTAARPAAWRASRQR